MSPDTLSLQGKVAIITGSGKESGLGAGIAATLARNGASVTINYVSDSTAPRAAEVVKKITSNGGTATAVQADVSSPDGAKKLVQETLKAFDVDKIDILVNNAGTGIGGPIMHLAPAGLERTFAVNVFGTIYMIQAAVPFMPRGGRVINISSIASKMAIGFVPVYSAAKAAKDSISYAIAQELGRGHGITINTISPGPVKTDGLPPDQMQLFIDTMLPLTRAEERTGTVEDIADAVLLLTSEKSRWITGQYISVSGGITGG